MALTAQSAARKDRTTGATAELQHRHFAFIAAVLASTQPDLERSSGEANQWCAMRLEFMDACTRSNSRFDRARFLAATLAG